MGKNANENFTLAKNVDKFFYKS